MAKYDAVSQEHTSKNDAWIEKNRVEAERFSKKKPMLAGMSVTYPKSAAVAYISWTPPVKAPGGNYSYPVNMNQNQVTFLQEMENAYLFHFRKADEYFRSQQKNLPFVSGI